MNMKMLNKTFVRFRCCFYATIPRSKKIKRNISVIQNFMKFYDIYTQLLFSRNLRKILLNLKLNASPRATWEACIFNISSKCLSSNGRWCTQRGPNAVAFNLYPGMQLQGNIPMARGSLVHISAQVEDQNDDK